MGGWVPAFRGRVVTETKWVQNDGRESKPFEKAGNYSISLLSNRHHRSSGQNISEYSFPFDIGAWISELELGSNGVPLTLNMD